MAWESGTATDFMDLLDKMRKFVTGQAKFTTPIFAGTGNGTLTGLESTPTAVTENWTLTCTAAALNGGTFSVVGSVSGAQVDATVGVPYSSGPLKFTINDGTTDFTVGASFTFSATRGAMSTEGVAWEQKRWVPGSLAVGHELCLMGKGSAGTDEIYVNFNTYGVPASNIYNWFIRGAAGFVNASTVGSQPGVSPVVGLSSWNSPIPYWFIASGRRIIVVQKISTFYMAGYFGLMLPFATPGQYPYPLFIGGNLGQDTSGSFANFGYTSSNRLHSNYWQPSTADNNQNILGRNTGAELYWVDGSWIYFYNKSINGTTGETDVSSIEVHHNYILPINPNWIRDNIDGSFTLTQHTLVTNRPSQSVAGVLEGSYHVSGFNNASENIITVDGFDHLVVQNINQNAAKDFAAIRLV